MLLRLEDVGVRWRNGTWPVRHVSFAVEPGQVLAVLGPNGSGKTSLLRLMAGTLRPTEGVVERHAAIGFVPQHAPVSLGLTASEMVLLGRARSIGLFAQPTRADERAALATMDRLGLAHLADQSMMSLSGGERQLVMVARALAGNARLLLMDEPTASLDLRHTGALLERLAALAAERGVGIVFTTHSPQHALRFADTALLMMPGNAVVGATDEVMSEARLSGLYDVRIHITQVDVNGIRFPVVLTDTAHDL